MKNKNINSRLNKVLLFQLRFIGLATIGGVFGASKVVENVLKGKNLKVSPTGLQILKILMNQTPAVISKERLTELLWDDFSPESDVLRSHIYLLRKAVDKPFDKQLIKTIPGVGITIS